VGVIDLQPLVDEVGGVEAGPVTVAGGSTRGGGVPGVRCVAAPSGIAAFRPDEMVLSCGAGTSVEEVQAAAREHGQYVNVSPGGTIGGALAMGHSDLLRLGRGPLRDVLLQARYVSAAGDLVTAGGPTVKNVTGFDLCRLLVGSRGTLGVLGDVIVRTRPRPATVGWFVAPEGTSPVVLAAALYRPAAVLWDGSTTWVCLQGHADDVADEAEHHALSEVEGPPPLPSGGRWSMAPASVMSLDTSVPFVAEVGVGIVHHTLPGPATHADAGVRALTERVKQEFDPTGRLSPGRSVLSDG
jgi:glycolate oxidase FAD binding subunit